MHATWTIVLQILSSPAGQALLQSTEQELVAALGALFRHAAQAAPPAH